MHTQSAASLPHLDILAHLIYASTITAPATLTTARGDCPAHLVQPDGSGVSVALDSGPSDVVPGEFVCLEYGRGAAQYRFYAEVIRQDNDIVRLGMPVAIERALRRLSPRVRAPAGAHFWALDLPGAPRIQLLDISVGGVCLSESGLIFPLGNRLRGDLVLPGKPPFTCTLEVRHLSLRRGHLLTGCQFDEMSLRNQGRLAEALSLFAPLT